MNYASTLQALACAEVLKTLKEWAQAISGKDYMFRCFLKKRK